MTKHRIAVIPVDGISKEGVPEGLRVLDAAATKYDIPLQWDHFDWNCDYYPKHETIMPEDWKDQIGRHDAIFFGSVGWSELKQRDFLSSNSDAARIAGLPVRFECDDACANGGVIRKPENYLGKRKIRHRTHILCRDIVRLVVTIN